MHDMNSFKVPSPNVNLAPVLSSFPLRQMVVSGENKSNSSAAASQQKTNTLLDIKDQENVSNLSNHFSAVAAAKSAILNTPNGAKSLITNRRVLAEKTPNNSKNIKILIYYKINSSFILILSTNMYIYI